MNLLFGIAALLAVGAAGCSSAGAEKSVDSKLGSEPQIHSGAELSRDTSETIENAQGITAEQKQKLLTLRRDVQEQSQEYSRQALKLKDLLVKEIVSPNYQAKEVDVIKKKLKDLDNQRLEAYFDAVEQANLILERNAPNREKTLTELFGRGDHTG